MLRWVLSFFIAVGTLTAQTHQGQELVKAALVADTTAIVPGQPFQVGVVLDMAPGWHTYWEYAGDAGIATSLNWSLPEGFSASAISWPLPIRLKEPGDIEVYAYKGRTMLLVTIQPPASLPQKQVDLKVKASWLVCEEICVPGGAELSVTLPVAEQSESANASLFAEFRAQVPEAGSPFPLGWAAQGKNIILTVSDLGQAKAVDFYPLPTEGQIVGHAQTGPIADGKTEVTIPAEGQLRGVLMVETAEGRKGWVVESPKNLTEATASTETKDSGDVPADVAGGLTSTPLSLWQALLYGFIGGLILNVMPCVLPVISLKIFGFIKQAGDHPGRILRHGLAFSAGIFAWFLGLGVLIIALKSLGNEVTWAFQFQNPWFNLVISCIVFVFALNLFGVFEIVLPGQATNALAGAEQAEGYGGSFGQGVFATLLATPCTAPFLGSALAFALSRSALDIFVMFGAIALGMASPYLLLSAKPGWMKVLPKPGAWMERVKQFMGFPLLATLIWLLSVLAAQKGSAGVTWTLAFLLCLGMACWVYGSFVQQHGGRKLWAWVAIIVLVLGGGWLFLKEKFVSAQTISAQTPAKAGGIAWQPFSQKLLDDLLAENKAVFVDFTADWCISCKYNEATAINVPAVEKAFQEGNIVALKADWTNANPEITAALKKFGRVGVPFYVLYPAKEGAEPIVLPEILTQQIVLDAIAKAR